MHLLHSNILDSDAKLAQHFMPHQIFWIEAEKDIHAQHKQAVALAEKSVRIGWTYADGFKNVRKRIWYKDRDYLFGLMNQLSVAEKRFPRSEADIASDYFALRKTHNGTKWAFSEGRNTLNAASHCDLAWAGALATEAHNTNQAVPGARVG